MQWIEHNVFYSALVLFRTHYAANSEIAINLLRHCIGNLHEGSMVLIASYMVKSTRNNTPPSKVKGFDRTFRTKVKMVL